MNSRLPPYTAICSFFNSANFVWSIYNSISSQTHSPESIIFVDDGSTDQTYQKIKNLASFDPKISVIHNNSNLGLAESMNIAISHVNTDYCAKFDADDLYSYSRIEQQLSYLVSNNLDLVGSWIYESSYQSQNLIKVPECHIEIIKNSWKHIPVPHNTWLFNVNSLKNTPYNKRFSRAQDQELLLRKSLDLSYANVQVPLCTYRSFDNDSNRILKLVFALRSKLYNISCLRFTLILSLIYYPLRVLYECSAACLTFQFTGNRKSHL